MNTLSVDVLKLVDECLDAVESCLLSFASVCTLFNEGFDTFEEHSDKWLRYLVKTQGLEDAYMIRSININDRTEVEFHFYDCDGPERTPEDAFRVRRSLEIMGVY